MPSAYEPLIAQNSEVRSNAVNDESKRRLQTAT